MSEGPVLDLGDLFPFAVEPHRVEKPWGYELILLAVELEAERLSCAHEEQLAAVPVGHRVD